MYEDLPPCNIKFEDPSQKELLKKKKKKNVKQSVPINHVAEKKIVPVSMKKINLPGIKISQSQV